jgi:hypothetical protein
MRPDRLQPGRRGAAGGHGRVELRHLGPADPARGDPQRQPVGLHRIVDGIGTPVAIAIGIPLYIALKEVVFGV